jgi:carboxylesterase type B
LQLTGCRIYGGGFTAGWKDRFDPTQLIKASGDEIVFVAMNYRVGAFGFLAGPAMQEAGGSPNAGLLDQRLAIDWVADNIQLFGGDPEQITVMGQSAGGEF